MATAKPKPLHGGPHSAGIFADMTVDGPIIGTLVAVFDRAKNLPNRKTMGKQNPYCAARLGKEAKKTETDMRGGQTPKWDQELRFTVHESPDYLQLKVSIFNDDKRTDLIGETWVDLKAVVIPGGGQSDQWHGLQFKGKYAGDLRMELTYYDTRPQDEAVLERRKEAENRQVQGGRQSKQPKRRPLPADPTGAGGANRAQQVERKPLGPRRDEPRPEPNARAAQPAQPQSTSHRYETPDDLHQQWAAPAPNANPRASTAGPPPPPSARHHQPYQADASGGFGPQDPNPPPRPVAQPIPHEYSYSSPGVPDNHYDNVPINHRQEPYYPPEQNMAHPYEGPQDDHYAAISPEREYAGQLTYGPPPHHDPRGPPNHHQYSASPPKTEPRDIPMRQSPNKGDFYRQDQYQDHYQALPPPMPAEPEDDEGPPPPPPVHRHGVSQPAPPRQHRASDAAQHPAPVQQPPRHQFEHARRNSDAVVIPEPLSISPGRISPNTKPPTENQGYIAYAPHHANTGMENGQVYSTSPAPSYHSYNERPYSRDRPPTSSSSEAPMTLAPVIAPQYNPTVVDESEENIYRTTPPAPLQRPSTSSSGQRPGSSRSSHDPRQVPARKSVSPQPAAPPPTNPDSLQGIPFSPDSFDTLNPNANRSTAVQQPSPHYSSPAEALEAARQEEVDKIRALGPIMGNDGREIDPSDHLPCDTWAPEPERKSRKPEVVVRFKHANAKTSTRPAPAKQPQPAAAPRPHSMSPQPSTPQQQPPPPSSTHASTSPTNQPPPSGRNRLQKRPQSYAQPSPALTPSPRGGHSQPPPAPQQQGTPPHHPGNHRGSSPSSSRVYGSQPPPIPAKVPIHPATHHGSGGSVDALSAEMRSIDIGGSMGRKGRHSFVAPY